MNTVLTVVRKTLVEEASTSPFVVSTDETQLLLSSNLQDRRRLPCAAEAEKSVEAPSAELGRLKETYLTN